MERKARTETGSAKKRREEKRSATMRRGREEKRREEERREEKSKGRERSPNKPFRVELFWKRQFWAKATTIEQKRQFWSKRCNSGVRAPALPSLGAIFYLILCSALSKLSSKVAHPFLMTLWVKCQQSSKLPRLGFFLCRSLSQVSLR